MFFLAVALENTYFKTLEQFYMRIILIFANLIPAFPSKHRFVFLDVK